jgi:hypothetical protein
MFLSIAELAIKVFGLNNILQKIFSLFSKKYEKS